MTSLVIWRLAIPLAALGWIQSGEPPLVPAHDLNRRTDLSGREVIVEGRSPRFEFDRNRGWNSFEIEGAAVRFRLPPNMSYDKPPTTPGIRVQGLMQITPGGMIVTVTRPPQFLPTDLERLQKAVLALPETDYRTRSQWAQWAATRADEYKDQELLEQARKVAAQALRIEADLPSSASPEKQLELARQARQLQAPEQEAAALVHRALRAKMAKAGPASEADQLRALGQSMLPEAARTPQAAPLEDWLAAYTENPAATYRRAEAPVRDALDRRLLADLTERALELRAQENPEESLSLAKTAADSLPDRPQVAQSLRLKGLERTDVRSLSLAEIQDRARLFESLNEPQRAQDLLRSYLDYRRQDRLAANDAEARLELADEYDSLLKDRRSAEALLREAWKIDPDWPPISEAFRRRGYTLLGNDWMPPRDTAEADPALAGNPRAAASSTSGQADPYRGFSRDEVLQRLGEPDSVARIATQGQLREQWIYRRGRKEALFLNFLQRPDLINAAVTSSHTSADPFP